MTRFQSAKACLAAVIGLFFAGCIGAAHNGHFSPDVLQTKMMRYQQVKLHQRLFYVGFARAHNLQTATDLAYQEITRQLTWLPSDAQDILIGLYRIDRTATDSEGAIHVLAVLDREAASHHLRRLRDENRQNLGKEIEGCRQYLNAGEPGEARDCFELCSRQIRRVISLHKASYSAVSDPSPTYNLKEIKDLQSIKERLSAMMTRKRSALVHVLRVSNQRHMGDFNPMFQEVLSSGGLKLASGAISRKLVHEALEGTTDRISEKGKKAGAGYLVVGQVKTKFTGSEMGQYFATSTARLIVLETEGGRILKEMTSGMIKGGHVSRMQACNKASEKAVRVLKRKLESVLVGNAEFSYK